MANPWRALIQNAPVQRGSRFAVSVIFFNGAEKIEPQSVDCDGTLADLTTRCINLANIINTTVPIAKTQLVAGLELDLTPPEPPIVDPPTPAQIAEAQYRKDRAMLDRIIASQIAGMPIDTVALGLLLTKTKSEYLPGYDA